MSNQRVTLLKERLAMYKKAEEAVLLGQEYKIGSDSMKRADLGKIAEMIEYLENKIIALERGNRKAVRITLRDI